MKHIYEINIFNTNENGCSELECTFMCSSRKRAIEFIKNVVKDKGEEGWLRTWTDENRGVYEITENEQIK